MRALRPFFQFSIVAVGIGLCLVTVALGQQSQVPDTSFVEPLVPTAAGVTIQQVSFVFDAGRAVDTDWGQIQIDPVRWGNATGMDSGYVQLVLYPDSSAFAPKWVVRNLYLPPAIVGLCPNDSDGTTPDPTGVPGTAPPSQGPVLVVVRVGGPPLSTYFDLRPDTDGSGPLRSISARILVSKQPLPEIAEILRVLAQFGRQDIPVEPVVVNAEGYARQNRFNITPVGVISALGAGDDLVGPPPLPPDPDPLPNLGLDLAYAIEVIQSDQPNVNCAKNQCVPMAQANVFGYLEDRYNALPLLWNLIHFQTPGIGKESAAGDVLFWIPVPTDSLVANVDALTMRLGVTSSSTGEGSDICQLMHGALGYIAKYGQQATAVFRHQGGDALYGENASCDDGPVAFGGLVSTREGLHPTWQWFFDQLQQGRGVAMCFGRYDIEGNRTSGHMVRVWGARRFNGTDYLYTLDDSNQGPNSTGLRTQVWEVADTGQPGLAGLPDGQLNMNGSTWEIEFAISTEAKPTLLIP
jgi:hypothetical protein